MPENQTWDTVTSDAPPAPAAPVVDAPVEMPAPEIPPAEASTLETTPQLDAEPVARESESQAVAPEPQSTPEEDTDVQEGDTPEIKALPSGSSSRQWARRQFHDAAPIRSYLDFDKPIKEFGDELHKRSASRYAEHVNDILTQHQDYASKQLFGVSYAEAKSRLQPNATATTPTTPPTPTDLPTPEQLNAMSNEDVAHLLQTTQEQARQKAAAEFQKQIDDLKTQFEAVNGKLTSKEQSDKEAEIGQKQTELLNNVLTVVDDGIRTSGLEVKPDDPPRIANLKRAAVRLLDKQLVVDAFDAVPENAKVAKYAQEAIARGEYQNAFREEENLKVRARAAFESVKENPEVKTILEEIEAYANQSKGNSRAANPVPPAPGSALGVQPPAIRTWDDAEKAA